jgi:Retrotransposon gag protein/Zinc knuckle
MPPRSSSRLTSIPEPDPELLTPVPEDVPQDIDNETKEDTPLEEDSSPNLAQAIMLMTDQLKRRENPVRQAKAKEPDTFDGSDSRKLNNFILLCNLYFRHNSSYEDDSTKVTFALSYLRGTALEYFEPSLLDSDDIPAWMDDWSAFTQTLKTQFGPIDPTADAENGIDNLKMQDNQHIVKYNVEFNRLAIRTGWDDSVLRHRYYSGLAERIKDILGQQGKPASLDALKTLAHSIDSRHWERLREKSRAGKNKSDKSDDKSDKDKSDKKDQSNNGKNNPNSKNNKGKNKSDKPQSSSGNSASVSDKLGKDGKLTPKERQRRFDNNLCMFCGGTGHTAKDCPKSSSSASIAKARAAQVKDKDSAKDPKKD